jgi:hypothetical protein
MGMWIFICPYLGSEIFPSCDRASQSLGAAFSYNASALLPELGSRRPVETPCWDPHQHWDAQVCLEAFSGAILPHGVDVSTMWLGRDQLFLRRSDRVHAVGPCPKPSSNAYSPDGYKPQSIQASSAILVFNPCKTMMVLMVYAQFAVRMMWASDTSNLEYIMVVHHHFQKDHQQLQISLV